MSIYVPGDREEARESRISIRCEIEDKMRAVVFIRTFEQVLGSDDTSTREKIESGPEEPDVAGISGVDRQLNNAANRVLVGFDLQPRIAPEYLDVHHDDLTAAFYPSHVSPNSGDDAAPATG